MRQNNGKIKLSGVVAGHIPYFYRDPEKIGQDFLEQNNALYMIADMFRKAPTTVKFRCSHFGEILASLYIQQVIGYKILIRKLSQTTAENTNVHKMDILCVNTNTKPYEYFWFEGKSSVSSKGAHRHGIYKQMRKSLENYRESDKLFDIVKVRDNLSSADFNDEERTKIRKDLSKPLDVQFHGIAVINISTICKEDDDFLLSTSSSVKYDVRILALHDLKKTAITAFGDAKKVADAAEAIVNV